MHRESPATRAAFRQVQPSQREGQLDDGLITNLLTNQCARRRICRHIYVHFPRSERANHGSHCRWHERGQGFASRSSTIAALLNPRAAKPDGRRRLAPLRR